MRIGSTFDILGPIMVGPSSSHTAGALRLSHLATSLCPAPVKEVGFVLYNSFATTFRGHGTDRALVAGVLGMDTDDPRIRDSFEVAREVGLSFSFTAAGDAPELHPNTVDITLVGTDGSKTVVRGESIGGGKVHVSRHQRRRRRHLGPHAHPARRAPRRSGMLARMTAELGYAGVNIAYMSSYRTEPGHTAYAVFETDTAAPADTIAAIAAQANVTSAYAVNVPGALTAPADLQSPYDFVSGADLLALCDTHRCGIGKVMRLREVDLRGPNEVEGLMARTIRAMRDEVREPLANPLPSLGGLIGGEAQLMHASLAGAAAICGPSLTKAVSYALGVLERSAAMGVIVAAPTAGSSGVVPGCLVALQEDGGFDDEGLADALYTAAAIGAIVEHAASVSGAEGGCQAEVGTASAMAAAAIVSLYGGTPRQSLTASSLAIANLLGLVCDPVRGLVEIPCQARNAVGTANAFTAAQMALAGIGFPIPFDEVVGAMDEVGRALPASLRETAQGGLAACASCGGCASLARLSDDPCA